MSDCLISRDKGEKTDNMRLTKVADANIEAMTMTRRLIG
jgi:hypothetical protein